MAEKRMFSMTVVDSDRFLNLPPAARLLYFEMGLRCDDDGFCSGPEKIMRMTGANSDSLAALVDAGLVFDFDGVVVLSDWRVHNCLRAGRLKPLKFPKLAARLWITETGCYVTEPEENSMNLLEYRKRFEERRYDPLSEIRRKSSEKSGFGCESQDRIGEDRRGEEKIGKLSAEVEEEEAACALAGEGPDGGGFDGGAESEDFSSDDKRLETFGGELGQNVVWLTDEQTGDLLDRLSLEEFDRYVRKLSDYILAHGDKFHSHYKTILKWWEEDRAVDKTGKARESPDRWPKPKQQPWQRALERPWEPPRGEFHEPPF